eukprot:1751113-Amphidinium_carterae.1
MSCGPFQTRHTVKAMNNAVHGVHCSPMLYTGNERTSLTAACFKLLRSVNIDCSAEGEVREDR